MGRLSAVCVGGKSLLIVSSVKYAISTHMLVVGQLCSKHVGTVPHIASHSRMPIIGLRGTFQLALSVVCVGRCVLLQTVSLASDVVGVE